MTTEPGIWLPLRFRDLDAFGHVYHAEYLTLLDDARTRWFGEVAELDDPGEYVVARIEIDYVSSLVLEDREAGFTIEVERVGASSVTLRETVRARDGRDVARVRSVTVRRNAAAGVSRALTDVERSSLLRFVVGEDAQ